MDDIDERMDGKRLVFGFEIRVLHCSIANRRERPMGLLGVSCAWVRKSCVPPETKAIAVVMELLVICM